MTIIELINQYEALGVQLWVDNSKLCFRAPSGVLNEQRKKELQFYKEDLIKFLEQGKQQGLVPDLSNRYEPFPLTDIQTAYLLGRSKVYETGGVGCHAYIELTTPILNRERLERAWHSVIMRHDMLRAVVYPEGYQKVLKEVTLPEVSEQNLRNFSSYEVEIAIENIRKKLSAKLYKSDQWPLYDLVMTTTDDKSILHFSIDMLIADFLSATILLKELIYFYKQPDIILPEFEVTYRDILTFHKNYRNLPMERARKEKDRKYWLERIDELSEAPELPMCKANDCNGELVFKSHKLYLDSSVWNLLSRQAQQQKITPSGCILAAYAEVIGLWSKQSKFCMNLTLLNRPNIHPQVHQIVGDFTTVEILEVNPESNTTFLERAIALQNQLWIDLEHNSYSGIEVLREMKRRRNKDIIMPVVYTSTIGVTDKRSMDESMTNVQVTYKITQTPQVWIDCQVSEEDSGLLVSWDVRNGIFPEGMIEDAFEVFENLLNKMASHENVWNERNPIELPTHVQIVREHINATSKPIYEGLLQEGFSRNVQCNPDKYALFSEGKYYTYQELADYAVSIQQALLSRGYQKGDFVAVSLEKGIWQIASVLGILFAGCIYVPIDVSQPQARKETILNESEIKVVITHNKYTIKEWKVDVTFINVEHVDLIFKSVIHQVPVDSSEPAYVIYTSGSTGKPKGVVMSHRSSLNTIIDINQRFNVGCNDKLLGLANLSFDLSVYDIFGLFTAGGMLVLPDSNKEKNPEHWLEMIREHGITLWNSVPAQLQMLISYWNSYKELECPDLRLVLLSGDWIPVALPDSLRRKCPNVQVISLGGATEAAIWSIFYPIENIPTEANSIPYGIPLSNQQFYVLNEHLCPCPDWVTGELYIGGLGLALEYLGDTKLTEYRFVIHPETGERLYRTGDMGRYRPDGIIEFLGREDTQVKIRGHRIELSEIENALLRHPKIDSAVAMISGNNPQEYRLNAFVQAKEKENDYIELEESNKLRELCRKAGNRDMTSVDPSLFAQWIKLADRTTLLDIMRTFYNVGLFNDKNNSYTLEEIISMLKAVPKYKGLIRRWLKALCDEKFLKKDISTGKYSTLDDSVKEEKLKELLERLEEIEDKIHCNASLIEFQKKSESIILSVLQGEKDSLEVLFPQGKLDTAMSAYHDNLINRSLNNAALESVLYLVNQYGRVNNGRAIRILEVGGGVGGTSVDLIPALADYNVEYYFTDVSTFFLNEVKNKFAKYPWVTYGIFDINKSYWSQGLQASSWDIIIGSNVLHNAYSGMSILTSLRELASPGGALVVIEGVRESYALLTSMGFEYGMTEFTDFRLGKDQIFFSEIEWGKMFLEVGADILCTYPGKNDILSAASQRIFITRFKTESETVFSDELRGYLESQLPKYMIPNRIEVLPKIPITSNGKINRMALKKRIETVKFSTPSSMEKPLDDLEMRISQIWTSALNCTDIGPNDSFFEVGGDSLLVAQVVAKMKENLTEVKDWEWDQLMIAMLKTPTVASIAKLIKSKYSNKQIEYKHRDKESTFEVLVEGKSSESNTIVLFSDGTGTLTPYNDLLPYLTKDPDRMGSIVGFHFGNAKQYLKNHSRNLIEQLGRDYAELLLDHGGSSFNLIGYCMGGLVAIETARVLMDYGIEVPLVTTIDTRLCDNQLENELLMERAFGILIGSDLAKAGHVVNDILMREALEKLDNIQSKEISNEILCSLSGPYESIGQCYTKLSKESKEKRLQSLYSSIPNLNGNVSEFESKKIRELYEVFCYNVRGVMNYQPRPFLGNVCTLRCIDDTTYFLPFKKFNHTEFWEKTVQGNLHIDYIQGNHMSCMKQPYVASLARKLMGGNEK